MLLYLFNKQEKSSFLKNFLCVLFLLLFSMVCFAQKKAIITPKIDPVLEFGRQQMEQKLYDAAISTIKGYLAKNPNVADGWYLLAKCYAAQNKTAESNLAYDKVVALKPQNYKINIEMGNMYFKQKNYANAILFYCLALTQNDTSISLFTNRGMSYYYTDNFEAAIKDFKTVISLDPNDCIAYNNLGSATYNNQNIAAASIADLKKAEGYFKKSIALKPDYQLAHRNIGIVYFYLDSLSLAYKHLLKATQLDKKDDNANFYLARVFYKQEDYKIAMQFFDNAIKTCNYKANYYTFRSMCKLELLDYEGAQKDVYQAAQLTNNKGEVEYQNARLAAAQDEKIEAIAALKRAKKQGLFIDTKYYSYIAKDKYLSKYNKDKDFMKAIQEIKFGK